VKAPLGGQLRRGRCRHGRDGLGPSGGDRLSRAGTLSLLATVLLGACAPDGGPAAALRAPILGGAADLVDEYPGVARIEHGDRMCSGTLVATEGDVGWVLTAGHCLFDPGPHAATPVGVPASAYTVIFGADWATGTTLTATAAFVHPGFTSDRMDIPGSPDSWPEKSASDVALLEITGVTPAIAATAIPWLAPTEDTLTAGSSLVAVGYGQTTPGVTLLPSVRQRVDVAVYATLATLIQDSEMIVLDQRPSATGLCFGDSGGPLVESIPGGEHRVAAVFSATMTAGYTTCRGFSASVRVAPVVDTFLAPVIAGTLLEPRGCYACLYGATLPGGACHAAAIAAPAEVADFAACLGGDTLASCRAGHAVGAAAYDAYWACVTGEGCSGLCTAGDRSLLECRLRLDGAGPCDDCIVANCCALAEECTLDAGCSPCINLLTADVASCQADDLYVATRQCLDDSCTAECAAYTDGWPALGSDADGPDSDGSDDVVDDADSADTAPPDDGAPDDGPPDAGTLTDSGGCECRATAGAPGSGAGAIGLALALALAVARRARVRTGRIDRRP
jgi:hypothetical protein